MGNVDYMQSLLVMLLSIVQLNSLIQNTTTQNLYPFWQTFNFSRGFKSDCIFIFGISKALIFAAACKEYYGMMILWFIYTTYNVWVYSLRYKTSHMAWLSLLIRCKCCDILLFFFKSDSRLDPSKIIDVLFRVQIYVWTYKICVFNFNCNILIDKVVRL